MIIIIRALSQWGKDDGDYDSPTSRDETPDFMKNKEAKEAQIRKEAKETHQKNEKNEKNERKREKGQWYYPYTTLVLQSSTMFFI